MRGNKNIRHYSLTTRHTQNNHQYANQELRHAKFFQLKYLFTQPNVKPSHPAKRNTIYSHFKPFQSRQLSPNAENHFNNHTEIKYLNKTARASGQVGKIPISLGIKTEVIHSRKYHKRMLVNGGPSQHLFREPAIDIAEKAKIKNRILEGRDLIKVSAERKTFSIAINAANYFSLNTQRTQRNRSIQPLGKPSSKRTPRISQRRKQGKVCRPWSPFRQEQQHLQIDELITMQ